MGSWKMTEYTIERLTDEIGNKKITVPKYQRGAIWKKSQKEKLIDSMNQGFPFGSILLYENNNKRQIIDGLQRSTTIIEFVQNPAQFFTDENLKEEKIYEIIECIDVIGNKEIMYQKLSDIIKKWVVDNHPTMQDVQRMQYGDLSEVIIQEWPSAIDERKKINEIIKEIFSEFQDRCSNMENIKVPALIYEGDENLLPEIFERINSQGAKLTKQQIYAATWAHDLVKLSDKKFDEIINSNRDRYEEMLDESMELEDYDSSKFVKEKEVDIFELVFGFGKMISRKYPYLFDYDHKAKTKVESVGFNLINACLMQKSSNMKNLNVSIKDLIGLETEKIEAFLSRIIESIEYVDKRLAIGTKFKGNTRPDSKINTLHTELQIVSIIATVFINRFVNFEVKNGKIKNITIDTSMFDKKWKDMKDSFDENVLKIYTMDILGQKWKGSGDKKLDNIIRENYYYARKITWKEFEQILDVYYSTINSERNEKKQVASPKEQEKLILNLIYSSVFTAADQTNESNYDIEHLATKNLMKEKLSKYSDEFKLPISSIANLCLLPEYENRVKQDKTIYHDEKYLNKINIQKVEEKYSFTQKEDFDWLDEELSQEEFKESYFNFLDKRFTRMKEKIKQNLFKKS